MLRAQVIAEVAAKQKANILGRSPDRKHFVQNLRNALAATALDFVYLHDPEMVRLSFRCTEYAATYPISTRGRENATLSRFKGNARGLPCRRRSH